MDATNCKMPSSARNRFCNTSKAQSVVGPQDIQIQSPKSLQKVGLTNSHMEKHMLVRNGRNATRRRVINLFQRHKKQRLNTKVSCCLGPGVIGSPCGAPYRGATGLAKFEVLRFWDPKFGSGGRPWGPGSEQLFRAPWRLQDRIGQPVRAPVRPRASWREHANMQWLQAQCYEVGISIVAV